MQEGGNYDNVKKKSLGGKYLTFKLGKEEYGLEILKVKEIIGLMDITTVPRTPSFLKGVINLRGKIIPVIDLRAKFGLKPVEYTDQTCIIVVDILNDNEVLQMGILIDSVSEVLDIKEEEIEEPPAFGENLKTDFILGMAKTKEGIKILLNIEDILTKGELINISNVLPA